MVNAMSDKIWRYAFSSLIGVCAFIFFGFYKIEILFFSEFFQMFEFGYSYFAERLSITGGLADYIAEFLTQFNYYPKIGAAIIAILFVVIQLLTLKVMQIYNIQKSLSPLSVIPTIIVWCLMCELEMLLTIPVSLIISLTIFCLIENVKNETTKFITTMIVSVLFYWLIGPMVIISILLYSLNTIGKNKVYGICPILLFFVTAFIASRFVMYPIIYSFIGINYSRLIVKTDFVIIVVIVFLPAIMKFWKKELSKKNVLILQIVTILLSGITINQCMNKELLKSARLFMDIYNDDNDHAIEICKNNNPKYIYSIQCLNLALAKKGILTETMFNYLQPGPEGLTAKLHLDLYTPAISSEIYWNLGAVDEAQRFAFESNANIGNGRNSAKNFLRLAETNMLNGQYEIANKYLFALKKTLFYNKIAQEYENLIYTNSVKKHPKFAKIDAIKLETDGIEEEINLQKTLQDLLNKNPKNLVAMQYLMATEMTNINYEGLKKSMGYLQKSGAKKAPKHVQEALLLFYYNDRKTYKQIPQGIDQQILDAFNNGIMENTYWKYLKIMKQMSKDLQNK